MNKQNLIYLGVLLIVVGALFASLSSFFWGPLLFLIGLFFIFRSIVESDIILGIVAAILFGILISLIYSTASGKMTIVKHEASTEIPSMLQRLRQ